MIQLHQNNQLWVRIKIERNWSSVRWKWSYQIGENADENFTGSTNSKWGAKRQAKRSVRKFIKSFVIVKIETSEFENDSIKS